MEKNPNFSGVYIDDKGFLNLGFNDRVPENKAVIMNTVNTEDIKFFKGRYSIKELRDIEDKFNKKWDILREKDIEVIETYVKNQDNIFYISVNELNIEKEKIILEMVGDHPAVKVVEGYSIEETNRYNPHDPLIGGVKVSLNSNGTGTSTLGFTAVDRDGKVGFVSHGHGSWYNNTGANVYQPSGTRVGYIFRNPTSNRQSDSSFVLRVNNRQLNGRLYGSRPINGIVRLRNQIEGMHVTQHGVASGITNGKIDWIGSVKSNTYGTLPNQVRTTYYTKMGDSGAAVTNRYSDNNEWYIYGIHWGMSTSSNYISYYSPIDGVMADLNLSRPLYFYETR
ncbi:MULTISPECIES: hypothetical protein [Bacillaceae]|uniref:S1 family peptidase n=1 Tax=Evansella alkalicola TaxID=745819 RepID=A0ABS6JSV3_9BACI|nr:MULTISPECIES: hypothetical protein [Bacillaceae]MBU9721327.1 S1 family peptidase [Bacillus alkalicola]